MLIVPTHHAPSLADLEPASAARLMELAHGVAAGIRASGLRCEGINLHVFPRFSGDGFGVRYGPHYVQRPRSELEDAACRIRRMLPDLSDT